MDTDQKVVAEETSGWWTWILLPLNQAWKYLWKNRYIIVTLLLLCVPFIWFFWEEGSIWEHTYLAGAIIYATAGTVHMLREKFEWKVLNSDVLTTLVAFLVPGTILATFLLAVNAVNIFLLLVYQEPSCP